MVRVGGDIDLAGVPRLTELVRQRLTAATLSAVVVDLTDVTFCGSAALELLLQAQHRTDQRGTALYVVPGPVMGRLLDLTGLRHRFSCRDDTAHAIAAACAG
nr:STAS domain-containing protein [Saccharopolyspora sp. HNM0983]